MSRLFDRILTPEERADCESALTRITIVTVGVCMTITHLPEILDLKIPSSTSTHIPTT